MVPTMNDADPIDQCVDNLIVSDITRRWYERIPARYVLVFFAFWGLCQNYMLRYNLSVAVVAMVNSSIIAAPNQSDVHECPKFDEDPDSASHIDETGEFDWTPSMQGVVLGAFFYGYFCTQLIGGRLAERVGGKWLFGVGIFSASLFSLATPAAARYGVGAMIVTRALTGLAEGLCIPSLFALLSLWAPQQERSTLLAVCTVGSHIGTVITMSFTGFLCEYGFAGGWPSVFYIYGTTGCIWFVFWSTLIHSHPGEHPRITDEELQYIRRNLPDRQSEKTKRPTPWMSIVKSKPVWALAVARCTGNWGLNTIVSKLPAYLESVMHYPIQKNGFITSVLYMAHAAAMMVSGWTADYFRRRGRYSTTTIRKACEAVAQFGPAFCLALVPSLGCDRGGVIAILVISMTCYGFISGGENPTAVDLAPDLAGTIYGFCNTMAGMTGFLAPLVAGLFLDKNNGSMQQWSYVFYLASGLYCVGAVTFTLMGSAEVQPWAVAPTVNDKETGIPNGHMPTPEIFETAESRTADGNNDLATKT